MMCECESNIIKLIWQFDWEKLSYIVVVLGGIYVIIQYRLTVKNSYYVVYQNIKNEVYSGASKDLSKAIREGKVKFSLQNNIPILHIIDDQNKTLSLDLLHNLEDLFLYYEEGVISKKHILFGFGHIIKKVKENDEIKQFIDALRKKENDPGIYSGIDKLYKLISNPN